MKISPIALGLFGENNLLELQCALDEQQRAPFCLGMTRLRRPSIALRSPLEIFETGQASWVNKTCLSYFG